MKISNILLGVATLLFFSCSSDDDTTTDNNNNNNNNLDPIGTIYAVGYRYSPTTSKSIATFWKGNTTIDLSDGTKDVFATGITMVGSDIYICGYEATSATTSVAKYWKNGVATNLTDGTKLADTKSITVVGNDIYVCGYENNTAGIPVAKYWKNGTAINLSDGTNWTKTSCIVVSGTDVYVSGHEEFGGVTRAKYWKNGVETYISNLVSNHYTNSIAVNGNDVIVVGLVSVLGVSNQKYWLNGNESLLPSASNAEINSVKVSNGDIYVGGSDGIQAKYWKNGVATDLNHNASAVEHVMSIFVYGNQVYCGGYRDLLGSGEDVATVWYNGTSTVLYGATKARVNSIYIVN